MFFQKNKKSKRITQYLLDLEHDASSECLVNSKLFIEHKPCPEKYLEAKVMVNFWEIVILVWRCHRFWGRPSRLEAVDKPSTWFPSGGLVEHQNTKQRKYWTSQRTNESVTQPTNEQTNKQTNTHTHTNKQTSKQTNKRTKGVVTGPGFQDVTFS